MPYRKEIVCDTIRQEVVRSVLERIQRIQSTNIKKRTADSHSGDTGSERSPAYQVEEILNNPYMNHSEIPLAMDIFKPVVPKGQELPVIIVIHGGCLVFGDRKISRCFGKALAERGYLVFSIEYRPAPRANTAEQLDDICAGMDLVGRRLPDFDVDFTRMFLAAESAGAFLAIYVAAMKKSKKLQKAIGYEPSRMTFRAAGLISGMFYTHRKDPIGLILSEQFYGRKGTKKSFLKYMDPEHPEIVDNLPPVFLITSRGDFLNNYTLMFHDVLKKAGRTSRLVYYGEMSLKHAFVVSDPYSKQGVDALDRMTAWFEEQADAQRSGWQF